jgi:hypothetical protein
VFHAGSNHKMQPGIILACSMWALTGLSLTLVVLRLYTRIHIVKFVGAEDYMYAVTGVSQISNSHSRKWPKLIKRHSYSSAASQPSSKSQ